MTLPSTITLCWRVSWATVGTVHTAARRSIRRALHRSVGLPRRTAHHNVPWTDFEERATDVCAKN